MAPDWLGAGDLETILFMEPRVRADGVIGRGTATADPNPEGTGASVRHCC